MARPAESQTENEFSGTQVIESDKGTGAVQFFAKVAISYGSLGKFAKEPDQAVPLDQSAGCGTNEGVRELLEQCYPQGAPASRHCCAGRGVSHRSGSIAGIKACSDSGLESHWVERAAAEVVLAAPAGAQASVSLWRQGEGPLEAKPWRGRGRPPKLLRRTAKHKPVPARELVLEPGRKRLKRIARREGAARRLAARFVAVRVPPAHRGYWRSEPHPELWLEARVAARGSGAGEVLAVEPARGDATSATGAAR